MRALLRGDLRQRGQRRTRRVHRERRIPQSIDAFNSLHRKVGIDRNPSGPVEHCAQPGAGRRRLHAGAPDHRSGVDALACGGHASGVDGFDRFIEDDCDAEAFQSGPRIIR